MARRVRWFGAAVSLALVGEGFGASMHVDAACPPEGHDEASLAALQRREFAVDSAAQRDALAMSLLDCLGSSDPRFRDAIAFSALQRWMREGALSPETLRALRTRLEAILDDETGDAHGVARPFAALTLSEVARTDRIAPWMRVDERAAMARRAAAYLASVRDYRGFEAGVGWRHGVAHGADWALQSAMNPALDTDSLRALAQAIASQVAPASGHAYTFGEPERLTRATMAIARRDVLDEAHWRVWFAEAVPRLGEDANAWNDAVWLARRHDASAFLQALYWQADRDDAPGVAKMKSALIEALRDLP